MALEPSKPAHIVVMGVAGCGKSTVGLRLAEALGLRYIEGDDHHLETSVRKMAAGEPLLDSDRLPWLKKLNRMMRDASVTLVISCSSLKEQYRRELADSVDLKFIYLDISQELALQRVSSRDHFFPTSLVKDQFETLEVPKKDTSVVWCDASESIGQIVASACEALADTDFTRNQQPIIDPSA